jgi:hypothetical protein
MEKGYKKMKYQVLQRYKKKRVIKALNLTD